MVPALAAVQQVQEAVCGTIGLWLVAMALLAVARWACCGVSDAGIEGMGAESAVGEMTGLPSRRGSGTAKRRGRSVTFVPGATCIAVPSLAELPAEDKAEVWWQQEDIKESLRVRAELDAAYKAAAEKIGVDVMQVASIGSHGDQGYRAVVEAVPGLAHESRRGLGLGRMRQRVENRDAYMVAILREQRRHEEEAAEFGDADDGHAAEALAHVAHRFSEADRAFAQHLAQCYHEIDRAIEGGDAAEGGAVLQDQEVENSATANGYLDSSVQPCEGGENSRSVVPHSESLLGSTSAESSGDECKSMEVPSLAPSSDEIPFQREVSPVESSEITPHRVEQLPGVGDFAGDIERRPFGKSVHDLYTEQVRTPDGHVAHTMANVFAPCGHLCQKVDVMCLAQNPVVPKVPSWLVGSHPMPLVGRVLLDASKHVQGLATLDPWAPNSVPSCARWSTIQTVQLTSLRIMDGYFQAGYQELLEYDLDEVMRAICHHIHIMKGMQLHQRLAPEPASERISSGQCLESEYPGPDCGVTY